MRPTTRHVRRRTLRRLDDAIDALGRVGDPDAAVAAEATHRVRTRCKEARALLRLVLPADAADLRHIDALVDEAGESLGTARDEQVLAETLDALPAAVHLHRTSATTPGDVAVERAMALLRAARGEVAGRRGARRTAPILDGVTAAYRSSRRRLDAVRDHPTDEVVHDWRRAVKRLTYQVRAVRRWAPHMLRPYAARLDDLGSLLGEDHDLSNAIAHLTATGAPDGSAEASAIQAARARQRSLRAEAIGLGSELFAERPRAFRARLRAYARRD